MRATLPSRTLMLGLGLLAVAATAAWAEPRTPSGPRGSSPRYERDILPIVRAHCIPCHGDGQRKGGLDLRTPAAMLKGGDSGPALIPGSAEDSLLLEQVSTRAMPPGKAAKLTDEQVATLRAWIEAGAPVDGPEAATSPGSGPAHRPASEFWAFQPPSRPAVPAVRDRDRVRTPVDAFV